MKRYFMMLMALAFTGAAFATPSEASTNGAAVYVGRGSPERPVLVACPSGGVYVAWPDARNGSYDIFMQLMGEDGTPRWVSNGVAVCAARETQSVLSLAPDDVGGVLLAWQDSRAAAAAIYAQRVDSTGVSTWPQGGVPVCAFGGGSYNPSTISDGAGGMVIAWQDHRSGRGDIFAQRLDSGGQALWSADGIALCTASDEQYSPQAVTDGSGGAIVAWYDFRTGQSAVYAQRVDSSGHPLWASDGIAVWTGATISGMPSIASDGVGGAIIVWSDLRSGTYKAYAQRLDSSGGALWPVGGIALVTSAGQQEVTSVASDGAGGAVTVVQRFASGEYDVFASAISAAGTLRWSEDGVAVCDAPGYQLYPVICADRVGGALVVWSDSRIAGAPDIYAQELDNVGVPTWAEDGVRICAASGGQTYPAVARGASGTGFLAWIDLRLEGAPAFIYSQGVSPDGALVFPDSDLPKLMAVQDVPNDQGGRVFLRWLPCIFDVMELRVIAGYRVWRKIPSALGALLEQAGSDQDRLSVQTEVLADGTAQTSYWEAVATLPAEGLEGYGYAAATTQDSLPGSNPYTTFFVSALTGDAFVVFPSAPDSGYSVDNLAPAQPAPFVAQYSATEVVLHWGANHESDLSVYRLYRGSTRDFVPGPDNLLTAQPDTGYTDHPGGSFYYCYKLAAVDVHGNESRFAVVTVEGPTAALASLVSAECEDGVAQLLWLSAGNPGIAATVYRSEAGGLWGEVARVNADGTGYIRFDDPTVLPAQRYGYRLGIQDGDREVFLGEVWIVVPALRLALHGMRPNPAVVQNAAVAFTLPGDAPASLEVYDVSGRLAMRQEVGSLGSGYHEVALSTAARFRAGVYVIRLTQGGNAITAKAVVLP